MFLLFLENFLPPLSLHSGIIPLFPNQPKHFLLKGPYGIPLVTIWIELDEIEIRPALGKAAKAYSQEQQQQQQTRMQLCFNLGLAFFLGWIRCFRCFTCTFFHLFSPGKRLAVLSPSTITSSSSGSSAESKSIPRDIIIFISDYLSLYVCMILRIPVLWMQFHGKSCGVTKNSGNYGFDLG